MSKVGSLNEAMTSVSEFPNGSNGKIIEWDEGWEQINTRGVQRLQNIIQNGLQEHFTNQEFAQLYTIIYQMCIQKSPKCWTPQLYEKHSSSLSSYLSAVALPAVQACKGDYFVKEIVKRWEDHKLMKRWMTSFFMYLDRFYVKRHNKKPLSDVAIRLFRDVVFEPCRARLTAALLDMVARDRSREEVDRTLIRDAVQIFVEMGMGSLSVYSACLEAAFLQATTAYYGRESANWLAQDSCPEYLRKAELRFAQERKRLKDYLHPSSQPKLLQTLEETLLLKHQSEILGKEGTGVKIMLQTNATQDLSRLYFLYSAVPESLEPIGRLLCEFGK